MKGSVDRPRVIFSINSKLSFAEHEMVFREITIIAFMLRKYENQQSLYKWCHNQYITTSFFADDKQHPILKNVNLGRKVQALF